MDQAPVRRWRARAAKKKRGECQTVKGIAEVMETILIAGLVGLVTSVLGGVLSAIAIGGKDLGHQLAAMMGAFYGPVGGFTGVVVGLLALAVSGQALFLGMGG